MTTTLLKRAGALRAETRPVGEPGCRGAPDGDAAGTTTGAPSAAASPRAALGWGPLTAWLESPRGRFAGYLALLLELGLVVGFVAVYRPFDLAIYLWGGRAVTHGLRLYLAQAHANWFTYPPFAAALFAPLAALPAVATGLVWELGSVAAFAWSCVLSLKLAGYRPARTVVVAMVAAGLLLEPVYHTLYLGQVNLFLLALVLTDVWLAARGKHAGIGIGIATAIKLTPGIFIVLLLVARRTRDAVTAAVTFGCCVGIGFLVDPAASRLYWTHLFYDTARVGAAYISNQSPFGALARVLGSVGHVGTWYDAVPVILGAAGLVIGGTLARRGDWLGAAAVTGITGLLVSPISWTHHWVWAMPALVVLACGGFRSRSAAACGYLLFVLAPMWFTPHSGAAGDYGWRGIVTLIANCFLIAGLGFMVHMSIYTWRSRTAADPWPRLRFRRRDPAPSGDGGAPAHRVPASEWV